MAVMTESFNADGVNKIYTVATTILSQSHCRVDYYYDNVDHNIASNVWDVINNSIVFNTAPPTGYVVKITTSTDGEGLETPPSDLSKVADNIVNVNLVATEVVPNLPEILLADDNAAIATAKASEASQSATESFGYAYLSETASQSSEAFKVQTEGFKNEASQSATDSEVSNQASLGFRNEAEGFKGEAQTAKSASESARDSSQGYRNEAETFKNTTSGFKDAAETSKLLAAKYANEAEDVEVETGTYSAKHWSEKAKTAAQGSADNISVATVTNESGEVYVDTDVQASLAKVSEVIDEGTASLGNEIWINAQNIQKLKLT